jgi:hypothetical protein
MTLVGKISGVVKTKPAGTGLRAPRTWPGRLGNVLAAAIPLELLPTGCYT